MTQKFSESYICINDMIEWEQDGFILRAMVLFDGDTKVDDFDCYDDEAVERWRNDEWYFGLIRVSAWYRGDEIAIQYLGGVEINFNAEGNKYVTEVAKKELASEVIASAREWVESLCEDTSAGAFGR